MATALYTKTGDSGTSGLLGGTRQSKAAPVFEAIGSVDELNALIGWCLTLADGQDAGVLRAIQTDLFVIGATLADTDHELPAISGERISALEDAIDAWCATASPLTHFVLPGGHPLAAALHVARTVARRAERAAVRQAALQPVAPETIRYLNRLSDALFANARAVNARHGVREPRWIPDA